MTLKTRSKNWSHITGVCFARKNLRPIWGFPFQIDTGNHSPIWCKTPRHDPNNSEVVRNLVVWMDGHSVAEKDDGPWGALVVLAERPHQ